MGSYFGEIVVLIKVRVAPKCHPFAPLLRVNRVRKTKSKYGSTHIVKSNIYNPSCN